MKQRISFPVYGNAIPQARARVFVDKRTGKIRAANPQNCTDWKHLIQIQALEHRPTQLLDGALKVSLVFQLPRPASKPKKEYWPRWKPDWDNLAKALTDACEGLIYTNDSRIVDAHIVKCYGDSPGVMVTIEEM